MKRLLPIFLPILFIAGCAEESAPAKRQPPPPPLVELTDAEQKALAYTVERTGTLHARHEIKILTREEGQITALPHYEGDAVEKGDLLLELDAALLRAQLKKAAAQRRQAEVDLKRLERLRNGSLVAEDELARARTALDVAKAEEEELATRLEHSRITAPVSGVISQRLAEPGDVVGRFEHVLTLIDPDALLTEVTVSELLLPTLTVGSPVEIRIDALGDHMITGHILRIHPTVNPMTRQGTVEVALEPAPHGALPGQLCRVRLAGKPEPRLTVPFTALRRDAVGEYVFVAESGKARRRTVHSGLHFADRVELLDGVSTGERIVVKGFLGLTDGSAIRTAGEKPRD